MSVVEQQFPAGERLDMSGTEVPSPTGNALPHRLASSDVRHPPGQLGSSDTVLK